MTLALVFLAVLLAALFLAIGFFFGGRKAVSLSKTVVQAKSERDLLEKEKENLLNENREREEEIRNLTGKLERETVYKESAQQELEGQKNLIEEMRKKLHLEFESLSRRIFEKETETYKKQSEESLSALLNPLKEKITDFKKQMLDFYDREGKERHSLGVAVKDLLEAHKRTTEETAHLTRALKGNVKIQGDWGEMVLERILKASGLRQGEEFTLQGKGLKMKTEEGGRLKPDVVVHLPDNRDIVIDSKVSLTPYYRYMQAKTEREKEDCIRGMIHSLLQHIKDLAEKDYSASDRLRAPDFTFMFIPIEGVFFLALNQDQRIFEEAWARSIFIVTPTNLLAALKTVSSIWKLERQNKNVRQIASESGKMYDKFVGFLNDMKDIGKSLDSAQKNYDSALRKLQTGQGNLVNRAEKIKQLGASSKKELPPLA